MERQSFTDLLDPANLIVDELLTSATRLFNRQSFAGVTMESIADHLQVSMSKLHYYFPDKRRLIYRCHARGLSIYRSELESVAILDVEPLERVRRFIRHRLLPGRPRMIGFSDLGALTPTYRRLIQEARLTNVQLLASILEEGMRGGSIVRMDPLATAIGLFSILDWMPFWYSEHDYYTRHQAAEVLDDIVTYGVFRRADPLAYSLPDAVSIRELLHQRLSVGRRDQRREHVLINATRAFNELGVTGASMDLIAQRAGLSRNAIYHHASDKADLLFLCLKRAFEIETEIFHGVCDPHMSSAPPPEVAIIMEFQLHRAFHLLHWSSVGPKSTYQNVNYLSERNRAEIMELNESIAAKNRARVEACANAGAYRQVDTFFVQQVGAGLRNNIPAWAELVADRSAVEVADSHAALMLFGLKPR